MKTLCRNSRFWFSVGFRLKVGCGDSTSNGFHATYKRVINFKLEDDGEAPPLIIFYQQAMQKRRFYVRGLDCAAYWLWAFLQVLQAKQVLLLFYRKSRLFFAVCEQRSLKLHRTWPPTAKVEPSGNSGVERRSGYKETF
jgi:hypothetical protein